MTGGVLPLAASTRRGSNTAMQINRVWRACREFPRRLLGSVDEAIMPLRCAFCGTRTLPGERLVCDACRGDLPWLHRPRLAAPAPITTLVTPLAYEFPVDAAVKALKFKRRLYYAPAFAELLCDAMRFLPRDIDALLPVPLHWRRRAFRGFNQALEISAGLRRSYGLPLVTGVVRSRATRSQSGLSAAARRRNVRDAFVARRRLNVRHVLIVDDVITTGATTRQLARVLLRSGAEKVSVLAVARATQTGGAGLKV